MAGGAAAAAAAIAQAIKASGELVQLEPAEFSKVLSHSPAPLVIVATGGLFKKNYQYLTSYKGLAFHTQSSTPLQLPPAAELITAQRIWIP